jgi:hypothetical protein
MLTIPNSRLLAMISGRGIGYVRSGPRSVRIPPAKLDRIAKSLRRSATRARKCCARGYHSSEVG